jgi:hypothetical protein
MNWPACAKDLSEIAAHLSQAVALLGAGGFFAYKAYTGYLRVNLTLTVSCTRQRMTDDSKDYLVIQIHLKKGPNGSVALHDVRALVRSDHYSTEVVFTGNSRSSYRTVPDGSRCQLDWSKESKTSPLIKLVPDEETDMSGVCEVPLDAVCTVEVAVLGKRVAGTTFGQWKASCVSLPVPPSKGIAQQSD